MIHSGAVIGSEGFGFVPSAQGWVKLEQSGYTVLEDRVEVGCNSTVDRPAVGETRIGYNSKLDNLVHVGHNCRIGQNCILAGQSGMAGGGKTGNWVILGGQSLSDMRKTKTRTWLGLLGAGRVKGGLWSSC